MAAVKPPKFRIYPSNGIARLGTLNINVEGIPNIVYVAFNGKDSDHKTRLLEKSSLSKK